MRAAGRVAIGVCTANRPQMLRCCLAALASQVVPSGFDLTIVVADNEAEPNNKETVAAFATTCPFGLVMATRMNSTAPLRQLSGIVATFLRAIGCAAHPWLRLQVLQPVLDAWDPA
jgi:hypothetical protein